MRWTLVDSYTNLKGRFYLQFNTIEAPHLLKVHCSLCAALVCLHNVGRDFSSQPAASETQVEPLSHSWELVGQMVLYAFHVVYRLPTYGFIMWDGVGFKEHKITYKGCERSISNKWLCSFFLPTKDTSHRQPPLKPLRRKLRPKDQGESLEQLPQWSTASGPNAKPHQQLQKYFLCFLYASSEPEALYKFRWSLQTN